MQTPCPRWTLVLLAASLALGGCGPGGDDGEVIGL